MNGVKLEKEPERLSDEQVVRGYVVLQRVVDSITGLRDKAQGAIINRAYRRKPLTQREVTLYNLFYDAPDELPEVSDLEVDLLARSIIPLDIESNRENPFDLGYLGPE